jgi:hypothetical protein
MERPDDGQGGQEMRANKLFVMIAVTLLFAGAVAMADPPTTKTFDLPNDLTTMNSAGCETTIANGNWGGRGADGSFAVAWEHNSPDVPAFIGRWAEVTITGVNGRTPKWIEIGYLAGVANDDFCLLVEKWKNSSAEGPKYYVAIGCVNEDENNTSEFWMIEGANPPKRFDLPNIFHPGQDVTVQIRVTGNAWSGFGTWGQLAIDYIRVRFE